MHDNHMYSFIPLAALTEQIHIIGAHYILYMLPSNPGKIRTELYLRFLVRICL